MCIATFVPEHAIAFGEFVKPAHDPAVFYTIWITDSNIGELTFTVTNFGGIYVCAAAATPGNGATAPNPPAASKAAAVQQLVSLQQTNGSSIRIRIVRYNGVNEDHTIESGDTRSFSVPDAKKLLVLSHTTEPVSGAYTIVKL